MSENLEELLRQVFSCDTEAGYRFCYHIMRALACEDYAKKINFRKDQTEILWLFCWASTPEGVYWNQIDLMTKFHRGKKS